jgi:hypothetical protein
LISGLIAERIAASACERALERRIGEVRIGLCYAAVVDDRGGMGIAAVLPESFQDCRAIKRSGFTGEKASEVIRMLAAGETTLERTLGLACANAVLNATIDAPEQDALDLIRLSGRDHVCMVGRFPPLVSRVEQTGASLSILEKDPSRGGIIDPDEQDAALARCTVAIITATTIINGTLEHVLGKLAGPRHVALLGPSTPLCPEAFQGTPINHIGGSIVKDPGQVLRVVSEAGGTPVLRPYLKFVNLFIKGDP